MATVKATDENFKTEVLEAPGLVVVDFWAEWCGPCRMIGPFLEDIAQQLKGQVRIAKLNVEENRDISARMNILSLPTLMIFKNGHMIAQRVGAASKNDLLRWVSSML